MLNLAGNLPGHTLLLMEQSAAQTKSPAWQLEHSYTTLPSAFHQAAHPEAVAAPQLCCFNRPLARALGLPEESLAGAAGAGIFSGNTLPPGARPIAQAYAGHQFGHFTLLGDGRAILLGEQRTPEGELRDIQLKGAGRTPFSRRGDGRAALGPMLREYLISEAMHALGIPTTRSLAVVTTGESVLRDGANPGAILTRVSKSHLRIGTFEYAAAEGDPGDLRALADYTLARHYPELSEAPQPYAALLARFGADLAGLIARWQAVGFIHGVMNTDNMALSGETIDYGPCAFMDAYNPETVFSSIDHHGRYAYRKQAPIAQWNLARLAEALLPLLPGQRAAAIDCANQVIERFPKQYEEAWLGQMRTKLGLFEAKAEDAGLIDRLLACLQEARADYTNSFRLLSTLQIEDHPLAGNPTFAKWHGAWRLRLEAEAKPESTVQAQMDTANPAVIPRNHLVETSLQAASEAGDFGPFHSLLQVLTNPYQAEGVPDTYTKPPEPSERVYQTFCGT